MTNQPTIGTHTDPSAKAATGRQAAPVVFLVNVDWFFLSHFVFLAERLIASGRSVTVLTQDTGRFDELRARGLEVAALPARRNGLKSGGTFETARVVAKWLKTHPDAVLHGFGIFGIVTGALARRYQPGPTVFTVTGLGYIVAAETLQARLGNRGVALFCKTVAERCRPVWIVENKDDAATLGLQRAVADKRVVRVGGAGVDLQKFPVQPMPQRPPVRLVSVVRLIWSKGVDLVVAATVEARRRGAAIELTIAGEPDPANPRSVQADEIDAWRGLEGISVIGFQSDVPALLATHHGMVLASRGGEGIPKSLIEAAAASRVILTTNVPGCATFGRETGGWVVQANSVSALADAMVELAQRSDLDALGASARRVVEQGYTQDAVWQSIAPFYQSH